MSARQDVMSRALAAGLGGYLLTQVMSVALAAPWLLPRADAALLAMQLSFLIYAAAVMWAFAARSASRAWAGMTGVMLISGALAWLAL